MDDDDYIYDSAYCIALLDKMMMIIIIIIIIIEIK